MDYVQQTIKKLEGKLAETVEHVSKLEQAIDVLRRLSDPAAERRTQNEDRRPQNEQAGRTLPAGRSASHPQSASRKKPSTPAKPASPDDREKSGYKGVRRIACAGGGFKYHASYWDAKKKKAKHLGTFDDELVAAAKVQDALGNTAEAQKLRDMVKQIENNPDRGKGKEQGTKAGKTSDETYFECNKCGRKYENRPERCSNENCRDTSFRMFDSSHPSRRTLADVTR